MVGPRSDCSTHLMDKSEKARTGTVAPLGARIRALPASLISLMPAILCPLCQMHGPSYPGRPANPLRYVLNYVGSGIQIGLPYLGMPSFLSILPKQFLLGDIKNVWTYPTIRYHVPCTVSGCMMHKFTPVPLPCKLVLCPLTIYFLHSIFLVSVTELPTHTNWQPKRVIPVLLITLSSPHKRVKFVTFILTSLTPIKLIYLFALSINNNVQNMVPS